MFTLRRILCGGDPVPQPGGSETTDAMMAAMIKNLPDLTRVTGENILPLEQAKLNAARSIAPQENQLALDLYAKYGPALNALGADIMRQNQMAAVGADAAAMQKAQESGLIEKSLALQREADPEYYKNRALIADKQAKLLAASGDGGLTPTEMEEVARGLSRTNVRGGVNDLGSPTAAVQNALQFGSAGQARRNNLAQILSSTAQTLPAMRSNFDPFQVSTGRSAFSGNLGESKFQSADTRGIGQNTLGLSQNLLSQAGENQRLSQNLNAQRRSGLDVFNQTFGSIMGGVKSLAGGIAGFR
jgi:hypothetical protein